MDVINQLLGHLQASRYAALASSCIIFFDYFLTLDEEVQYIWKAPWTPGKILFVLNRYYTLIAAVFNNYGLLSFDLTDDFCLHFIRWQGYTGLISAMVSQMILQMRIFALYCMNRTVIAVISTFFVLSSAASATLMTQIITQISVTAHVIPQYPFCTPFGLGDHFFAFWIPILATEAMLCFAALYRGYLSLKEDREYAKKTRRDDGDPFLLQSGRRLIAMLIHDSVLYFLATFATYAANLIMFIAAPPTLLEIPIGFSVSIASVLSSRLILRVRHVRKEIEFVNHISHTPPASLSPLTFAAPSSFGSSSTGSRNTAGPLSPSSPLSSSASRPPVIGSSYPRTHINASPGPSSPSSSHVNTSSHPHPNGRRPSISSSTHSMRLLPGAGKASISFSPPSSPADPNDTYSPAPTRIITNAARRFRSNWRGPPSPPPPSPSSPLPPTPSAISVVLSSSPPPGLSSIGTMFRDGDVDVEKGTNHLGIELEVVRTPTRESCIGIAQ